MLFPPTILVGMNQAFGNFEDLANLNLSNNSFTWTIPSEFRNLKHGLALFWVNRACAGEKLLP